jgi:hypothetical protein
MYESEKTPLEVVVLKPVAAFDEILELRWIVNDLINVSLEPATIHIINLLHS